LEKTPPPVRFAKADATQVRPTLPTRPTRDKTPRCRDASGNAHGGLPPLRAIRAARPQPPIATIGGRAVETQSQRVIATTFENVKKKLSGTG